MQHERPTRATPERRAQPPRIIRGPLAGPAKLLAHVAALPLRAAARERPPAVAEPGGLRPGDPPPTDGRLLLLFDGGCGICLHARDAFAVLDRRHRLAFDRIARHDHGLLSHLPPVERYGAWHVVHPDGRQEHGWHGIAATFDQIPGGRLPAGVMRRFPEQSDRFYKWFVHNRGWISRGSGLINHPQRDAREQLTNPRHHEVVT